MPDPTFVYVGTYTDPIRFGTGQVLQGKGRGIHIYRFDHATGELTEAGVAERVVNPSYLAFDPARRFLYAVNEMKEFQGKVDGAVSAFRIDPLTGGLGFLNIKATHGTDPCHLMVDRQGRCVLVANFASGSVCVLPINPDGSLGDASDVIQHEGSSVHPTRQTSPHAHAIEIDAANRFVFVPELGLDKVMIYELDSARGKLSPNPRQPFVTVKPGAGPRQLVMHPNGRFAYLINELDSTITAYRYDPATGRLEDIVTVPTLPSDFSSVSTCAEVQVAPSGKFLYGSNRGHDSIVVYAIDEGSGSLTLVGHEDTRGRIPRNFAISPTGAFLAVANQDSNNLVLFRVDPGSGHLTQLGREIRVGTPVCVRFF
jgi:6-phosphogluconolactonase